VVEPAETRQTGAARGVVVRKRAGGLSLNIRNLPQIVAQRGVAAASTAIRGHCSSHQSAASGLRKEHAAAAGRRSWPCYCGDPRLWRAAAGGGYSRDVSRSRGRLPWARVLYKSRSGSGPPNGPRPTLRRARKRAGRGRRSSDNAGRSGRRCLRRKEAARRAWRGPW